MQIFLHEKYQIRNLYCYHIQKINNYLERLNKFTKNKIPLIILNRDNTPLDNIADLVINGELKDIVPRISDTI